MLREPEIYKFELKSEPPIPIRPKKILDWLELFWFIKPPTRRFEPILVSPLATFNL